MQREVLGLYLGLQWDMALAQGCSQGLAELKGPSVFKAQGLCISGGVAQ